ncbi:MAG TPA: PEP-CTERM sorting domain-containing protein, partial [Pirellulales bacterium]|nr:PEP-CTERM sorting domain-containing protein [Pirellulales bacterium]
TDVSSYNAGSTVGSQVPTSGDNLVSFNLTSTNAVGTFKIVAFNDASNGYSNWTYYNAANPSDPNNANDFAFTNIGSSGSFPGSEQQFVLGTINVMAPAAVPEPGSLVLAGIAAAGYAGYGWRRKRRLASEPLPNAGDGHNLPA